MKEQAEAAPAQLDPWDQPLDETTEQQIRKLEQRLAADQEAWIPEPGETLSGTVTAIEKRKNQFGEYPAITVQTLDGAERVFHAMRTVALNEVIRQAPKPGDLIAILYLGKAKDEDYHRYRVRIGQSRERDFDWSQFAEKKRDGD